MVAMLRLEMRRLVTILNNVNVSTLKHVIEEAEADKSNGKHNTDRTNLQSGIIYGDRPPEQVIFT